jgi:subtilisin family serine protease
MPPLEVLALACSLLAGPAAGAVTPAPTGAITPAPADDSSVLVRFRSPLSAAGSRDVAAGTGARLQETVDGTGFAVLATAPGAAGAVLRALADDPRVVTAEPNWLRQTAAVPSDPHYLANQAAYLGALHVPAAWDLTTGSDDQILAVVDSGVTLDHPELAGRLLPGRDVANDDNDPDDFYGHGTQVATVAAATGDNGAGMAGLAWRGRILPVKVLDSRGTGRDSDIAAGIVWAADHGADVINLSLFGRSSSQTVRAAIEYAQGLDAVVIAAAGNDHSSAKMYPAAYDGVIAVSAVDAAGDLASFSNYGPWIDLAAPGVDVLAGWADGTYRKVEGTSFAAPLVSGVAMLARARFPDEDAAAIARRLQSGARDAGLIGRDDLFGAGIIDALGAVGGRRPTPAALSPGAGVLEPDNTPDRASALSPATPATAALAPGGDVDWFALDVPAGSGLDIALTPPAGAPAGDYTLEVFDPGLAAVGTGTAGVGGVTADVIATAGRYAIRVRGDSPFTSQEPYRLAVAITPVTDPPVDPPPVGERLWVRDTTPADGSWTGDPATAPALRFARPLDPDSVADATVTLTDGATGDPVAGAAHYEADTNSVVFAPSGALVAGHPYRLSVAGVRDTDGVTIPAADCCLRFGVPAPPDPPAPEDPPAVPMDPEAPPAPVRSGYWALGADGHVHPFGDAQDLGNAVAHIGGGRLAADLEPTPGGGGYWIVDSGGAVFSYGDAAYHGGVTTLRPGESVTSLSATPTGGGYWLFTTLGRAVAFGDAESLGDMDGIRLNGPVLDSIATPTGRGYYLVAADGGVFSFGDARFFGSMGGIRLNAPVQSLVPDPDGTGYWLVAGDGGVFSFAATFRGSMGDVRLNAPVTGMVPFGDGYLMVGADGGIFNFSDRPFSGSLGAAPPPHPIVAVAAFTAWG